MKWIISAMSDKLSLMYSSAKDKMVKVKVIDKEIDLYYGVFKYQGVLPSKQTDMAAGFDLCYAGVNTVLQPGEIKILGCGIALELPEDICALVLSRSGLATKGIFVVNAPGLIDPDYRGEIKVILGNISQEPFQINTGDRIAQLLFVKTANVELVQTQELSQTKRGEKGLGSTGV